MSVDLAGGDDVPTDHPVSRVSFHHVTLQAGNESVLLRFEYETREQAACLLVDAGDGLDLDSCLRPTDRLAGVCLTHAHADHYQSLDSALGDDVPLYTSPATAAILETVLTTAEDSGFVSDVDRVLEATTTVDGWVDVAPNVRLHPVPAGHTPGAVGFVVRFRDEHGSHDMLFTGDFTRSAVGGYPGFETDTVLDVETLFLTVATADGAERELTDGVAEAVERAHGGASVLVTASGLQGVQLAVLLEAVAAELELDVPVRVVGQAAKLYENLEYDHETVRAIPEFERPQSCLDAGVVTIAGPDVPREGSAGRLYGSLRDDPNACLVQFVSSGTSPITGGGSCTTSVYEGAMHPTSDALDAVVDAFDPIETVTVHEHGGAGSRYNDWDSCVWSATEREELMLYDDGQWLAPPWTQTERAWGSNRSLEFGDLVGDQLADVPLPSFDRTEPVELGGEELDVDRLRRRLHVEQPSEQSTTTTPMTDTTDRHDESSRTDSQLYSTVRAQTDTTGTLSTDSLVPGGIVARRAWKRLGDDADDSDRETRSDDVGNVDDAGDTGSVTDTEDTSDTDEERTTEAGIAESDERSVGESERPAGTTSDADVAGDVAPERGSERESEPASPASPPEQFGEDERRTADDAATVALDVDPLLFALVERQTGAESVAAFVTDALDSYLRALLRRGETPDGTTDALDVDVAFGDRLGETLAEATADEGYGSVSTAVRTALAELLGDEATPTVTVPERELEGGFVDAAVANDDYGFETRREFVDAAVLWALDEQ